MPCCTICGVRSSDPLANWGHLQRAHKLILKRFQCGFCPSYFMSMSEFYEHKCSGIQPRVFSCSCSPDKYFGAANGFCDHFDALHIDKNTCVLCGFTAPSQEVMARHRSGHMKVVPFREPPKKIFILSSWLYPKKDSGYSRYIEGGSPPPSYLPIDRSRHYLVPMLGGTVPVAPRTMTLFDALENVHRSQTAAATQPLQPHRPDQPTTAQPITAPVPVNRKLPPPVRS